MYLRTFAPTDGKTADNSSDSINSGGQDEAWDYARQMPGIL